MNIGKAIKLYRIERDINATELANKINITCSYLSGIEHNHKVPSFLVLECICLVIGIKMSEIIARGEEH